MSDSFDNVHKKDWRVLVGVGSKGVRIGVDCENSAQFVYETIEANSKQYLI